MATIDYQNADGSIKSSVVILKGGWALEVNAPTKKTWPSMDAWAQKMPREWRTLESWVASLHIRAPLAYFLSLPEGATTSREAIRYVLVSYLSYRWCRVSYWKKRHAQPANPVYRIDDLRAPTTISWPGRM
jgi:hypothetical protein